MRMKWYLITGLITAMLVMVGILGNLSSNEHYFYTIPDKKEHEQELHTFDSFSHLEEYLNSTASYKYWGNTTYSTDSKRYVSDDANGAPDVASEGGDGDGSSDYSTTNVQVEGVDEGDIVKNDGEYAYIVSQNKTKVFILDVYPANEAEIVSEIEVNWTIKEIYLNNNKLIILGLNSGYYSYYDYYWYGGYSRDSKIIIEVYDITIRSEPSLIRKDELKGSYVNSRMIGNHFYIIVNQPLRNINNEFDLPAPPDKIHYINNSTDNYYSFTNIVSINVKKINHEPNTMIILMGSSNNIYVSTKNIFITCTKYDACQSKVFTEKFGTIYQERTVIIRISINKGLIKYEASGSVPGRALNRFSMDEYNDHFRIATTTGRLSRLSESSTENHVYVLDYDLSIVGSISNIAPGESIYSARFMGRRGYIVTFKKVDPFFVIDLSVPSHPVILGKLKIPGYSNYLHPYDEKHVIGIGKETVEAEEGDFAWYQGVKISLFDVTNVGKPKELSKIIIGDRGTNSDALFDPHAFLFSKDKNLLVIPIQLAEIDEDKYPNGAKPNTHGVYVWSGAYVFKISTFFGIRLKGRITHLDDSELSNIEDNYYSSYSNFNSRKVKRSFYIDDVLYTVSDHKLKANDLGDLDEVSAVELPHSDTELPRYYID
jgi:uncharacterized secreted protein with C-terminal beta-propeller domain